VGVAAFESHALGTDAELVGDNLAERGRVALAVVLRAGRDGQRSGRIEAQLGVLDQSEIGRSDRVGDANAAQLAALARFRAALGKAHVVGPGEAVVQVLSKIAAV